MERKPVSPSRVMYDVTNILENIDSVVSTFQMEPGNTNVVQFRITQHITCEISCDVFSARDYCAWSRFFHNMKRSNSDIVKGFEMDVLFPMYGEKAIQNGLRAFIGLMLTLFFPAYARMLPRHLTVGDVQKLRILDIRGIAELSELDTQLQRAAYVVPSLQTANVAFYPWQCVVDSSSPCKRCLADMAMFGYKSAAVLLQ